MDGASWSDVHLLAEVVRVNASYLLRARIVNDCGVPITVRGTWVPANIVTAILANATHDDLPIIQMGADDPVLYVAPAHASLYDNRTWDGKVSNGTSSRNDVPVEAGSYHWMVESHVYRGAPRMEELRERPEHVLRLDVPFEVR